MTLREQFEKETGILCLYEIESDPEEARKYIKWLEKKVEQSPAVEKPAAKEEGKLVLIERFADNGEHSHWKLIDGEGNTLWSESKEDMFNNPAQPEGFEEWWSKNNNLYNCSREEASDIYRAALAGRKDETCGNCLKMNLGDKNNNPLCNGCKGFEPIPYDP